MLKTIQELITMLSSHKVQLYTSLVLSFVDSCLLVVPIIVAFIFIGLIPEFSSSVTVPLTSEIVIRYITLMVLCIVLRVILRYFTLYFRSGAGYEVMNEERKNLGQNLRNVSMGFFNKKNLGDLVATITSDVNFIELDGMGVVEKVAIGVPAVIIGLAVLSYFEYKAALAALILMVPTYIAYHHLASTQDRLNLNRQEQVGAVTGDAVEFVRGLHVLKTCNMTEQQFFKTQQSFAKLRELSVKIELLHIPPTALFQLCFRLITVVIIMIAGISLVMGAISFQAAFLLMLGGFSLFSGAEMMGVYSIFGKMTQQSIDRINHIKDISKMEDTSGEETIDNFDLAFDRVSFAYENDQVLTGITFTVPQNTTTALVGLSGGGKTTIINLLARFWDIKQGQILIGGKNVKSVPYELLLKNLSFVFQDVFLFNDTIENNIRIGRPDASIEEVKEASWRAGCHDFISQLENGYDTIIGEAGSKLSGGEKQRISIARALLKDAPIVLLDEATANVDIENEEQIQIALRELLENRTVIIIAHKLASIQRADQIIVLEKGEIIQKGVHNDLVTQEGLYQRLWNMQFYSAKWTL